MRRSNSLKFTLYFTSFHFVFINLNLLLSLNIIGEEVVSSDSSDFEDYLSNKANEIKVISLKLMDPLVFVPSFLIILHSFVDEI